MSSSEFDNYFKEIMDMFRSELTLIPVYKDHHREGVIDDLMEIKIGVRGPDDKGVFPLNWNTRWYNTEMVMKRTVVETGDSFAYRVTFALYTMTNMFGRGQHFQQKKIKRMLGIK